MVVWWTIFLTVLLFGCDTADKKSDESELKSSNTGPDESSMYDVTEPLQIEISLDESDFDTLCSEGRTFSGLNCDEFSYTHFFGEIAIGDEVFKDVRMRKKGFLGSISTVRPSLKLNLGAVDEAQRYLGEKRLTLNNNRQDATLIRQCLLYQLFEKANLPAPRCSFAHVTVNGKDLGIYTNVEPIKKQFLARVFDDDSGNLYEGTVTDLTKDQYPHIEVKTNEKEGDTSDLAALAEALDAPDSKLEEALSKVINLDAFYTFWAMEVLTGHWDGYSGNRNNFYLYHNPEDDLFYFIPWGADGTFLDVNYFRPRDQDVLVYPNGEICRRLYALDDGKKFKKRVMSLLDEQWDVDEILERAASLSDLADIEFDETEQLGSFIKNRRSALEDEFDKTIDVSEPTSFIAEPYCGPLPNSSGTMEVKWTNNYMESGILEGVDVTFEGKKLEFEGSTSGRAGISPDSLDALEIGVWGKLAGTERYLWLGFNISEHLFEEGTIPFHGYETIGLIVELFPPTFEAGSPLGVISDGDLTLERVGDENGDVVRLSWEGTSIDFGE